MQAAVRLTHRRPPSRSPAKRRLAVAEPHTRKVPAARESSAYAASFRRTMAVAVVIAVLAMIALSQRVLITQNGAAIDELRRQVQETKRERQQLQMTLIPLQSPKRIEGQAMTKLRMIQPLRVSYIQLPMSGSKARVSQARKTGPGRESRAAKDQGILRAVFEQVTGQVQLLPLGNVVVPAD